MMLNGYIVNSNDEAAQRLMSKSGPIVDAIMKTSRNIVALFDEDGDLVIINETGARRIQIDKFSGEQKINMFDSFSKLSNSEMELLKKGETVGFDTTSDKIVLPFPSEDIQYYRMSLSPILNDGERLGYVGVFTDISVQTHNERKLRHQSEQLHRQNLYIEKILQQSNIVLWRFFYTDESKEHIGAEKLFGEEDIERKATVDFESHISAISPDEAETFFSNIKELLEDDDFDKLCVRDHKITNPDTLEVYHHRCAMSKARGENDSPEVLCVVNDITDLVDKNEKIEVANFKSKMLIKAGGMNTWEFETDDNIPNVSAEDNKVLMRQMAILKEYMKCVKSDDVEGIEANINDMLNGRDFSIVQEYMYQPKGHDTPLCLLSYFAPFTYGSNGKVLRYIGYTKDITESKKFTADLESALKKAESADKLKTQFLANMSHEIRTPLNAIVGFSEMLTYANTEEEKLEWQKHIYSNSDLLLHLIDDIIDLSKIESDMVNIVKEEFDFSELICGVTSSLRSRIESPDVKMYVVNPLLGLIINEDQSRITQVLSNFITNAIKYTEKGYVKVGYELLGSELTMWVKDSGCGIKEKDIPKLFSRFEKLSSFSQGTGLGLAINKAIVERMGGECGCQSVYGEGSYFWAKIPVEISKVISMNCDRKTEMYIPITDTKNLLPKDLKVLVVEDN